MSTFKEIIARVDEIKPNAFSENLKLNWLTGLNGKIAADVFLMDIAEIRELPHGAEAIDCKPLIGFPHEEVYDEYLAAKIDAANGEASEYQNRMQIYDAYYMNFVIWFKSIYDPVQGDPHCHGLRPKLPTYYITAYGLAVMKGFTGTLEQWLESLTAYGVARSNGFEGTAADWLESLTAYGVARKQGFEGSAEDWLESIKGESLAAKVEEIPGGYRVTITDAKEAHSFDVMNGVGAVSSVGGLLPDKDGNVALTVGGVAPDQKGNIALTVANIAPDENGNIPLKPKDIGAFPKTGGAVEGPIDMGGNALVGLPDPASDDEAASWGAVKEAVNAHAGKKDNPHGVTAAQVGAVEMKKLWEKASPVTAFAAQTISVDLSGYDYIEVHYRASAFGTYKSQVCKVGEIVHLDCVTGSSGAVEGGYCLSVFRIGTVSNTGIAFSKTVLIKQHGSDKAVFEENNSYAVPTRIFGIKGVT